MSAADPVRELLSQGLGELGLDVGLSEPLAALSQLVADWAVRMNLTGHRTATEVARRLVLDALALARAAEPEPASLADLGSGAGFPGLPIAILWPRCRVTLVESRERRHHFQRAAIRALGLSHATALRGRAEELTPSAHEVVVAQAMAAPTQALEWMAPWVTSEGRLLIPCAEASAPVEPPTGVERVALAAYRVPLGGPPRSLWIGRRAGPRA